MAIISCPECNHKCSSQATACPNCGYPFKSGVSTVSYETQVVQIRCWGRGQKSINDKLFPYTSAGWEVVTMVEDHWQGGMLSPVYKVTIRRPRHTESTATLLKNNTSYDNNRGGIYRTCPHCGATVTTSECSMCGKTNNFVDISRTRSTEPTAKPIKSNKFYDINQGKVYRTCPHCGETVTTSECGMCGKKNNLFD